MVSLPCVFGREGELFPEGEEGVPAEIPAETPQGGAVARPRLRGDGSQRHRSDRPGKNRPLWGQFLGVVVLPCFKFKPRRTVTLMLRVTPFRSPSDAAKGGPPASQCPTSNSDGHREGVGGPVPPSLLSGSGHRVQGTACGETAFSSGAAPRTRVPGPRSWGMCSRDTHRRVRPGQGTDRRHQRLSWEVTLGLRRLRKGTGGDEPSSPSHAFSSSLWPRVSPCSSAPAPLRLRSVPSKAQRGRGFAVGPTATWVSSLPCETPCPQQGSLFPLNRGHDPPLTGSEAAGTRSHSQREGHRRPPCTIGFNKRPTGTMPRFPARKDENFHINQFPF